ncbi:MAG: hypothetical protein CL607_23815 [Anaerolineaceae bacterium]|nr:hypothetical protein [Anaerolineaceae bacterium]
MTQTPDSQRIAQLNDQFRQALGYGTGNNKCYMTQGIMAYSPLQIAEICAIVKNYDDFTGDNDPYGEHDFGSFTYGGEKIFWKIDYYDNRLKYGSDDPANPDVTTRVLTILLASEY